MHSVGQFLGREVENDAAITQWDPPNLWAQKSSSGALKFENTNRFESKDGGTLLVQSFEGGIGGFFKMAEGLAAKQMEKQVISDGERLKKLLEAR
jgi:hypothetical protein